MESEGVAPEGAELYRAMVEENGMPKLGASATTLGVRKAKDIDVDANGDVHPPAFHAGGKNGLSCAPRPQDLPGFLLPQAWGGLHKKTTVWKIRTADLGRELLANQDGPRHISVGPARVMTFDEFSQAIEATAPKWVPVYPGGGDGEE